MAEVAIGDYRHQQILPLEDCFETIIKPFWLAVLTLMCLNASIAYHRVVPVFLDKSSLVCLFLKGIICYNLCFMFGSNDLNNGK